MHATGAHAGNTAQPRARAHAATPHHRHANCRYATACRTQPLARNSSRSATGHMQLNMHKHLGCCGLGRVWAPLPWHPAAVRFLQKKEKGSLLDFLVLLLAEAVWRKQESRFVDALSVAFLFFFSEAINPDRNPARRPLSRWATASAAGGGRALRQPACFFSRPISPAPSFPACIFCVTPRPRRVCRATLVMQLASERPAAPPRGRSVGIGHGTQTLPAAGASTGIVLTFLRACWKRAAGNSFWIRMELRGGGGGLWCVRGACSGLISVLTVRSCSVCVSVYARVVVWALLVFVAQACLNTRQRM